MASGALPCDGNGDGDAVSEMELSDVFGESAPARPTAPPVARTEVARVSWSGSAQQEYANGAVLARFVEPHTTPQNGFEAAVLAAVQRLKAEQLGVTLNAAPLTAHLVGLGYAAQAVVGGRCSSAALALRNTFVTVDHVAEDGSMTELIVEPHLRSHFQISRPSLLYSRLIDDLPDEFVGDAERLSRLCYFVSDQMGTSFAQNGLSTPPWRSVHSLLTKWNVDKDRSRSPERAQKAAKQPTFCRRTSTDCRTTTAAAAAAAQAAQYLGAVTVPWMSR